MSSIPQNTENKNQIFDSAKKFLKEFLETIVMVKKSSKVKYGYQDVSFNIKEIYSKNRKRRGSSILLR